MAAHDAAVELARSTLVRELGCAADAVALIDAEAVEWSDSALGCPRPGMLYMQVITPGYRVTLEHNGQRYQVHTDAGQRAVRCHPLQSKLGGKRAKR
jgi:hypothetical protein